MPAIRRVSATDTNREPADFTTYSWLAEMRPAEALLTTIRR